MCILLIEATYLPRLKVTVLRSAFFGASAKLKNRWGASLAVGEVDGKIIKRLLSTFHPREYATSKDFGLMIARV
jgi:hypothetical protein